VPAGGQCLAGGEGPGHGREDGAAGTEKPGSSARAPSARCKKLLRGLKTVKLKPGAQYIETETREQHVTMALGYLVTRLFPARRYVKSGKKH